MVLGVSGQIWHYLKPSSWYLLVLAIVMNSAELVVARGASQQALPHDVLVSGAVLTHLSTCVRFGFR